MNILPKDLLVEIGMELGIDDILSLCRSSKKFTALCDSDLFWRKKLSKDYGLLIIDDPKEVYRRIVENKKTYNSWILEGKIKSGDEVLLYFQNINFFENREDYLIFSYIVNKLLVQPFQNIEFDLMNKYNISPSEDFTEQEYETLKKLLASISLKNEFLSSVLSRILAGDIPLDAVWEDLKNINIY